MNQIMMSANCRKILSLDMANPKGWATNFIEARAIGIVDRFLQSDEWGKVLKSAINAKIDPDDKQAVVLHGLQKGIVKTASQKQAAFEAEQATGVKIPDTKKPTTEQVDQEVIKRKLVLVNVSDVNQLNDSVMSGTREAVRLLKIKLTREWTTEEKARAEELDKFEAMLGALEKAGALIKADITTGKITKADQTAKDKRWPK